MTNYIKHRIELKPGAKIEIPDNARLVRASGDDYDNYYVQYRTPRPEPVVREVVRYGYFSKRFLGADFTFLEKTEDHTHRMTYLTRDGVRDDSTIKVEAL